MIQPQKAGGLMVDGDGRPRWSRGDDRWSMVELHLFNPKLTRKQKEINELKKDINKQKNKKTKNGRYRMMDSMELNLKLYNALKLWPMDR